MSRVFCFFVGITPSGAVETNTLPGRPAARGRSRAFFLFGRSPVRLSAVLVPAQEFRQAQETSPRGRSGMQRHNCAKERKTV
jgi:hypothetical protein